MRQARGQVVEVETLADLDRRIAAHAESMSGWHLQSLDLRDRSAVLRSASVAGALFLGCRFAPGDEDDVRARGALVFPQVPGVPVDSYRAHLYTAEELYDHLEYDESLDARVYAWSQQPPTIDATLAQALHDHAVDDALEEWVEEQRGRGRPLVGVMGGHALQRGSAGYRDAALLGRAIGGTHTVATGGGPGAMEAANLGAWLPDPDAVDHALTLLADVPSFRPDIGAWARVALDVRRRWPEGGESLGVPTWHYGHEPSNLFATALAKYFRNATREAILLALCDGGIVFLPGAGGTVQEIFQDACENYYADASSIAPMVLVGASYWTDELPAWPLLRRLSLGRPMEGHVHLVDTVEEAAALILGSAGP